MSRTENHAFRRNRRGLHRLFFVLVLLPMLCVFPYLRMVNNPNEFVRVFTVMSLVENHTFKIDEQVKTWGWVNDMAHLKIDGAEHYFMVKAPAAVYLGLPGYVIFSKVVAPMLGKHYADLAPGLTQPPAGKDPAAFADFRLWWLRMATWSMRLFGTQLPCFLFLLWFERYLRDFSPDPAIRYATVAAAGLGTNYLAYTHMFASHSQYAAAAFTAFALVEREGRRCAGDLRRIRPSRALLAGFLTSTCVALEYQSLFFTIVLTLYATLTLWSPLQALFWVLGARTRRLIPVGASVTPMRLLAFGVGGLLNIPHVMYFHWAAYGNPFTPGHQQLETARFAAEHKMGLWGILWPTWDHIGALLLHPGFGLIGMSPFMALGLLGAPLIVLSPKGTPSQRSHLRAMTIAIIAAMSVVVGVNAGFVEWRAGWTVGPRYLVVCAPFFAFAGAIALERLAGASLTRRALCRGVAGGLALASVLSIGTVGLLYDTLPTEIARPFAQFSVPMIRAGVVPHHIGEWFGWSSTTPWYLVCAAMLLAPTVALWPSPGDRPGVVLRRVGAFVGALALGMVPAFSTPEDATPLFRLHPSVAGFATGWEPAGRDRLTALREEAERYGTRGIGPCLWYRVADLERALAENALAARDEARARSIPRERCPKYRF